MTDPVARAALVLALLVCTAPLAHAADGEPA